MMYLKLVKVFFKESFSLKRILGYDLKQHKKKSIFIGIAIIYALVVFISGFSIVFYDLAKMLDSQNQLEIVLSFGATYLLGLSVMMALFRSSGYIFYYKDYAILAPLPISGRTVLFAKLTVMLLLIYITSFIFVLPIYYAYFSFSNLSFFGLIYFVVGFLLTPLIPLVVLSFVSLLITNITSRLPFAKLFNIIFMFVMFVSIFSLSFTFNETEVNPLTGQINIIKGLADYYPPIGMLIKSVHGQDHLSFLLFFFISVGSFVGYVFIVERLVKKTNQTKQKIYFNKRKKVRYQQSNVITTLVKKEIKFYFSIPIYVFNTGLGIFIILIISIASLFFRAEMLQYISTFAALNISAPLIFLLIFGFSVVTTYTPAISLSLEGKRFWILKTLPIDPYTVMLSKIIFNLVLVIPVAVIGITLISFTLSFDLLDYILMVLGLVGLALFSSTMDSFINLFLPKFEFLNEVEVVKQSIASFLGMFGGMALLLTLASIYLGLNKLLTTNGSLITISLVLYLGALLLLRVLKVTSRKQFSKF